MARHLFSQLAHVELLTPKFQESLRFFKELLGMEESGRSGDSVYLRCWDEDFHHSIKLTPGTEARLGHTALRTDGPEELDVIARIAEANGMGLGWINGDLGHGKAYRFRTPDGHVIEAFWEVERYLAPPEQRSRLKNRPQKNNGRGAAVRRLDHINMMAREVAPNREFLSKLGFKHHEGILLEDDTELGAWMAVTNLSHDVAFMRDPAGASGRLNHVAFALESREDVMRATDFLKDQDIFVESGPGIHGVSEAFFSYVYEPGGHRIEIYSGGYLNFAPDWGPVMWYTRERPDVWLGGDLAESVKSYGTPPIPAAVK